MKKKIIIIFFIIIFIISSFAGAKSNSRGKILITKKALGSGSSEITDIFCIDFNGETLDVLTKDEGSDYNAAWSPDGKSIAFISNRDTKSNSKWDIYNINENGSNLKRLTNLECHITQISWSPDGEKIVFISNKTNLMDIFIVDNDGNNLKNLTENDFFNKNPVWSPDGSKIAFLTNKDGGSTCYIMNSNGTDQKRLLKNNVSCSDAPSWSPDGKKIVCNYNNDIAIINLKDLSEVNITKVSSESNLFCGNPQWSPDGKWIAYDVEDLDKDISEIYLMDSVTLESYKVTNGSWYIEPKWAKDSKNIFFFSPKFENDLYIYNLETKNKKRISNDDLIDRHISVK